MKSIARRSGLVLTALVATACAGGSNRPSDAGRPVDASMRIDASSPGTDAGAMDLDAGAMDLDAGAMDLDAGAMDLDAGPVAVDAGPVAVDAGSMPGGDGLAAVRAGAVGPQPRPIAVRGVTVTYARPLLGDDPAGFFVQANRTGPAVFVAVDPATLSPAPAAGDVVAFDVTEITDVSGAGGMGAQRRVTALSGWARTRTGADIAGLAQDLSGAGDVVSAVASYESEYITITGQLEPTTSFTPSGTGHRRIQLTTASVADAGLVFRAPEAVITGLGLRPGCEITVTAPLWRFGNVAQVMGYRDSDVTVLSCPPPTTCAPATHLVINEVDYDQTSTDTAEFVEIYNPTDASVSLSGYALVHVDGAAGNAEISRAALSGSLAAGAYLVVSTTDATALGVPSGVARATFTGSATLQNGPDAVVLVGPSGVVDVVAYEGPVTMARFMGSASSTALPEGMTSAGTDTGAGSLQRSPNGCDTDAPSMNFMLLGTPTPGAANP